MRKGLLTLFVVGTLSGCAAKYRVVSPESASPVLSGECELQLYEKAPEGRAYSILGTAEPEDPSKLALEGDAFLDAVREEACKRTANAVIANRDAEGRYVSGTIIRVR